MRHSIAVNVLMTIWISEEKEDDMLKDFKDDCEWFTNEEPTKMEMLHDMAQSLASGAFPPPWLSKYTEDDDYAIEEWEPVSSESISADDYSNVDVSGMEPIKV